MGNGKVQNLESGGSGQPLEDRALKMAAQFFGNEMLPLLGVKGRILRIAPNEQIHLEMKQFLEDFNFEICIKLLRNERDQLSKEDLCRMESILYTFAVKFTTGKALEKIKEALNMTVLGQMLVDDGIDRGIESVAINFMDLLDDQAISERTGLSLDRVAELRKTKQQNQGLESC